MLRFFEKNTEVAFIDGNRVPDFHATPGAATGGRSVAAKPYDGRRLGPWIDKLRPPLDVISLGGMGVASGADLTWSAPRKSSLIAFVKLVTG
ncbi:FAD-binding dehydrogenase, partial [Amaricoccus sp. HAR-UPW-R2A-40]